MQIYCVVQISFLSFFAFHTSDGFNLSPKPNLILKEPNNHVFRNKTQSSYFGFTINLRSSSIIVGAPRAQSTLKAQLNINETGAIYKCMIENSKCKPLVFDDLGNIIKGSLFLYKDHQWLGASMDGGAKETDPLVVCAPRITSTYNQDSSVNGICYWTPNTKDEYLKINIIDPLAFKKKPNQVIQVQNTVLFINIFGEQGISAHITANNKEALLGAPGVNNFKGAVVKYIYNPNNIIKSQKRLKVPIDTQTIVVNNTNSWKTANDTYFGYSVGSGYFNNELPKKTYYVAASPQANNLYGQVYIFDIIDKSNTTKYYSTFNGTQFGSYFGYAVLAEDLNNDKLTDLIITAPLYSLNGHTEQGAIYVFINKGNFDFELKTIINSPYEGRGHYGTSISKLGDINQDGFNDIAVGAPFAGNGVVFIYLGDSEGLRSNYSQQLNADLIKTHWGKTAMFGHGLSKGSDIDNNGFNDFAIGAPNAESVFLFKAYPVVKINAAIKALGGGIKPNQTEFKIEICYNISTKSQKIQNEGVNVAFRVKVNERVTLVQNNLSELVFHKIVTATSNCELLNASVTSKIGITTPVRLYLFYDLVKGIPNSDRFCDDCVAVDPVDSKVTSNKIIFNTGCKMDACIASLRITSSGLNNTFILGSSGIISIVYEVTNSGETAYAPQIKITSSNKMPFKRIPPACEQKINVLLCYLNSEKPMFNNSKEIIKIAYDASKIKGSSINLTASVFSEFKEQDPSDDVVDDAITLLEFTEIEVHGKTNATDINLGNDLNTTSIINNYEVNSRGPSNVEELQITLEIPIAHKFYGSNKPTPIIDANNITLQYDYNIESETQEIQNGNKLGEDSKTGSHNIHLSTTQVALNNKYIRTAQINLKELHNNELPGSVQIDRTIVFSCMDPEMTTCARHVINIKHFEPLKPLNITLKYNVDLSEVKNVLNILKEPWESFVIITKLNVSKVGDLNGKTTNIRGKLEFIDISMSKPRKSKTPWTVIILSSVGGLLILAAIVFLMDQFGFFERKEKDDMEKRKLEAKAFQELLDRRLSMCLKSVPKTKEITEN